MPAANHQNLTIPRERHGQLMDLMDAAGAKTVSEMLGRLFATYREQGRLEHTVPGVFVNRLADGIALRLGDNPLMGLSLDTARLLAEAIRSLAAGETKQGVVNRELDFAVARKGSGVIVTAPLGAGDPRTYAPDLAVELAQLLERAAT